MATELTIDEQIAACQKKLEGIQISPTGGGRHRRFTTDNPKYKVPNKDQVPIEALPVQAEPSLSTSVTSYARVYADQKLGIDSTKEQDRYIMTLVHIEAMCNELAKDAESQRDGGLLIHLGDMTLVLARELNEVADAQTSRFKQGVIQSEILRIVLRFTSVASLFQSADDEASIEEVDVENSEEEEQEETSVIRRRNNKQEEESDEEEAVEAVAEKESESSDEEESSEEEEHDD
jgi:hypothetical protein